MPSEKIVKKTQDKSDKRLSIPVGRAKRRPEAIAERIKDYIRAEQLGPGDRLPQERDLIDSFKAAKGTVREAMKALETQGLVFTRSGPGGGAFVNKPSAQHAMELLSTHFFFDEPSLADIYSVRKSLEPEIAATLAGMVTDEQLSKLEETIRIYDHLPADLEEQYRQRVAELDFHAMLAQACPNPLLGFICGLMYNLLREHPAARVIYADKTPSLREEGLSFQYRLMAALKDGRTEDARRISSEHMDFAQAYMADRLASIEGETAA